MFWTTMLEETLGSPLDCKIKPVNPKGHQSWIFIGRNTLATWCEELTHWKTPWCWEKLKPGGEWDNRGRDGWMASPTQWTQVWVNPGSWQWTGRPGMWQSMGSQRVRHDWVTQLNWSKTEDSHVIDLAILLLTICSTECCSTELNISNCSLRYYFSSHILGFLVYSSTPTCTPPRIALSHDSISFFNTTRV